VKLGKNASDACAVLSEAYWEEAVYNLNVFEWCKRFKESSHFEITNEDYAYHFLRYVGYCSLLSYSRKPNSQPNLLYEILKRLHEAVLRIRSEIWPNDGFTTMTLLQLIKRSLSSSFWPKNQLMKWNTHPIPLT
jgi:hypothetical protein